MSKEQVITFSAWWSSLSSGALKLGNWVPSWVRRGSWDVRLCGKLRFKGWVAEEENSIQGNWEGPNHKSKDAERVELLNPKQGGTQGQKGVISTAMRQNGQVSPPSAFSEPPELLWARGFLGLRSIKSESLGLRLENPRSEEAPLLIQRAILVVDWIEEREDVEGAV